MRDESGNESHCGRKFWDGATPVFATRVLLGNKVIGVIERHEDNDQPSRDINWQVSF
jgi:hypothetical protein